MAKVVLRSLLTTLGGVGGDAAVISSGEGGFGGGNVAARLFFEHRGLGSGDDGATRRAEFPGAGTNRADEEAAQGGIGARRRLPVSFREEVEVLGEERDGRTGAGSPAQGPAAGAEIAAATTLTSRQASPDESLGTPPARGAPEERRAAASDSPPVVEESNVLRVCVERAMRLEATPAAATVSGDPEMAECAAPYPHAVPPPPSTYVTLRWEEEGKPPLRSPLLSGPAAASGEAGEASVANGEEEVSFLPPVSWRWGTAESSWWLSGDRQSGVVIPTSLFVLTEKRRIIFHLQIMSPGYSEKEFMAVFRQNSGS